MLTQALRIPHPSPGLCFGAFSDGGQALCILCPLGNQNVGLSRWTFDPYVSATQALALESVYLSLLHATRCDEHRDAYYRVVSHYTAVMPEALSVYVEPDIQVLASFALSSSQDLQQVAMLLLQGVVQRSQDEASLVAHWGSFYVESPPTLAQIADLLAGRQVVIKPSSKELLAALVLTLIAIRDIGRRKQKMKESLARERGQKNSLVLSELESHLIQRSDDIEDHRELGAADVGPVKNVTAFVHEYDDIQIDFKTHQSVIQSKAANAVHTLLRMIFTPVDQCDPVHLVLATDLLGKAFVLWKLFIPEPIALMQRLHHLSLHKNGQVGHSALKALLQTGRELPVQFVKCMGTETRNPNNITKAKSGAILAIEKLVRKYPFALENCLADCVQIITRCLDPSDPALRKSLLYPSTSALHVLVQKYPMVSFHQQSQRFAVGSSVDSSCIIIIYDLRTATKFRILDGHKFDISAIAFSPSGNQLVSYSASEKPPSVRVWNTGVLGFFSSLLGIHGSCTQIFHPVPPIPRPVPWSQLIQICQLSWDNEDPKSVTLVREDSSEYHMTINIDLR